MKRLKNILLIKCLLLLFLIIGNGITEGSEIVFQDVFENGIAYWKYYYKSDGISPQGNMAIDSNGNPGKCLMFDPMGSKNQYGYRDIGELEPGSTYRLSASFKTVSTYRGVINLFDQDWRDNSGNRVGKSFYVSMQGTGSWENIVKNIKIPAFDDSGNPVNDKSGRYPPHRWSVRLYGNFYTQPNAYVFYDNIILQKLQIYSEIEEMDGWLKQCYKYVEPVYVNNKYVCPAVDPKPDMIKDTTNKKFGKFSLRFDGKEDRDQDGVADARNTQNIYMKKLIVKPNTKYKLSAWVRVQDRACYNYLGAAYAYPEKWTDDNAIESTKGIWSGEYHIMVGKAKALVGGVAQSIENDADKEPKDMRSGNSFFDLLPPQLHYELYVSNSNRDWYKEEKYLQTSPDGNELILSIKLIGFDGTLWVDGLTLEEVTSCIEDKYLTIPIKNEFQGMNITPVEINNTPVSVATNAASFIFNFEDGGKTITLYKDQTEKIATIDFSQDNFLKDLKIGQRNGKNYDGRQEGIVLLENDNVSFSLGADSTLLVKLSERLTSPIDVTVTGYKEPKYHNFEAGIIFVTDYEKGILFSPIYPELTIANMPYIYNKATKDYSYPEDMLDKAHIKNWEIDKTYDFKFQDGWKVTYHFQAGEGFIASIFPPKDFSNEKYFKERVAQAGININTQKGDYAYHIQKFHERFNIALLWMQAYATSNNTQLSEGDVLLNNVPVYYAIYKDKSGKLVTPSTSGAIENPVSPSEYPLYDKDFKAIKPFSPIDSEGPFNIKDGSSLKEFVQEAHNQGVKVVVYMSPYVFYTSNPDGLLNNLRENIEKFKNYGASLDGVYYDGLYPSPLKTLELVRRTRNLLGTSGIYVQHSSWVTSLLPRSSRFRVPFFDAYADKLWVGEGVRRGDDDTWRLNYCGYNVSNTPSTLLAEARPNPDPNAEEVNFTAEDMITKQLQWNGEFFVKAFGYKSTLRDRYTGATTEFLTNRYWDAIDSNALSKIIDGKPYSVDGKLDIWETIYNRIEDAAPESDSSTLKTADQPYICTTDYSVAQWLVDNQPFYRLHFTFDDRIATDDSENRKNPDKSTGINYAAPVNDNDGGKRFSRFDGSARLFAETDETLYFTNNNFSSFAQVKITDSTEEQTIFSLKSNKYLLYGINNSEWFVALRSLDLAHTYAYLTYAYENCPEYNGQWHTVGVVYNRDNKIKTLKLYVDGEERASVNISLSTYTFKPLKDFGEYCVGALTRSGDQPFVGYIDDLFATDRALTIEQIRQYRDSQHKTLSLSGTEIECIINEKISGRFEKRRAKKP